MIPKRLHLIWIGDEGKRPDAFIQSWIDHHPDWEIRIWDNRDLTERAWINHHHMAMMATQEWCGVADLMRLEILFQEGGVLVDADSLCLQPIPDWLRSCEIFVCAENELARPGLLAVGYMGSHPRNPLLVALIEELRQKPTVVDREAWQSTGPQHLTDTWRKYGYADLTVLPSHFFIPRHYSGVEYKGGGPVYATQAWGSTTRSYEALAGDVRGSGTGQAFLYRPDWGRVEWVEVLLAYLNAFEAGEPVGLILLPSTEGQGGLPLAQAESRVLDVIARFGRDVVPEIILLDAGEDVLPFLRRFGKVGWIPEGRGTTRGLQGPFGARLAASRRALAREGKAPA